MQLVDNQKAALESSDFGSTPIDSLVSGTQDKLASGQINEEIVSSTPRSSSDDGGPQVSPNEGLLAKEAYVGEEDDEHVKYDSEEEESPRYKLEESVKPQYTKKMTETRKQRNAMFKAWFSGKVKEIEREASKKESDDEKMSAKALINSTTQIISQPRDYQLELFELAKRENILAVLNTGSGKTLIACLLIRYMRDQELEARTRGNHRRCSFFLVDSVTLVFQQTAVLNCNLDEKIGKYCGDMCNDLWNFEAWQKILDEHMVLVMTADVLYNCLTHAFVKMEDINLLCFDEAHHAKKNHVYARIIRDFYDPEPQQKRPKIFGMTASPVDARVDVVEAAKELEILLHSRIATTSDLALLQSAVSTPKESVIKYNPPGPPKETPLSNMIKNHFGGSIDALDKLFAFSEWASSELGLWCADYVWKFGLSELEAHKIERKTERALNKSATEKQIEKMEADIEKIRSAQRLVATYEFPDPKPSAKFASHKVVVLWWQLCQTFNKPTNHKCIIFVTRRHTARVLEAFLKATGPEHMKLGILIGTRSDGNENGESFTFRRQMLNVSRFRRGVLNCLIATSVAEEGLDIPDCNQIIRFDLYTTMIQYIQSRGRARHATSHYLHMIQQHNREHQKTLQGVRGAENIMKNFCNSLPEDRLLDKDVTPSADEKENEQVYVEPSTGAKLTMNSAMQVISHYVGHLPHDLEDTGQPTYFTRPCGIHAFQCELILPSTSPLSSFEGPAMTSKATAKRAVAFKAALQLRNGGYLDEYLRPLYRMKERPKMANAHLAVDVKKVNNYHCRPKPSFWTIKDGNPPERLWVTVIVLNCPDAMQEGKPLQPICVMSREKLPKMPSFPVYGDRGGKSDCHLLRLKEPLETPLDILQLLDEFTRRIFYDVFNKIFEYSYSTQPYWTAPLLNGQYSEESIAAEQLDWDLLREVASAEEMAWDGSSSVEAFENRFLLDKSQRSRRFAVSGWDPGLHPEDPIPEGGANAPGIESIRDYSYNAGHPGRKWRWVQWEIPEREPVLIADRILHRQTYLDPPNERDARVSMVAYICPSAFYVSMITISTVYSIMIFPAISHRIDAYLHAWDVCKIIDLELDLELVLEALTKDSDNTHEHGVQQENKQRGMGSNYERLEFLGDCYLKLGTSISLFSHAQGDDEFKLHVRRMVIICNQHLFNKAKELGIPEYIQTQGFSRRFWYPAMKLLQGKGPGKGSKFQSNTHDLGDKTIADVCEALIGAALLDKGLDGATKMVTSILRSDEHSQTSWDQYYKCYMKPAYQLAEPSASQAKLARDIEEQFGYKFKSARLLMSAFTHSSNPYTYERVPCYQRLEFLGDALLDLACVRYIFEDNPDADPQWLTEHKMAMVSNKFLGAVCVVLGMHRKLRKVGGQLDTAIRDYETEILEAREKNDSMNFWVGTELSPPKALPDILEAFIGALFVDSEFDYSVVQDFFDKWIRPYFVDMSLYDDFAGQHPTTFLSKKMTALGCAQWGYESDQFRDDEESYMVTAFLIHQKVFSHGTGPSVKTARVEASTAALKKLEEMSDEAWAMMCDCKKYCEEAGAGLTDGVSAAD